MTGKAANAFCAMRPPGHHAESAKAMGFCFFNNAAIAARHAQKAHGAERVAIVDWDVHHGNGTQEIFWDDPSVLYASTHEMPLYPGTGAASERGEHGTIVNAPLRAGRRLATTSATPSRPRCCRASRPSSRTWSSSRPASTRIGATRSPTSTSTKPDFAWATQKLMEIADRHAGGRVVSILEGGYDLEGLSGSVAAHVTALMRG